MTPGDSNSESADPLLGTLIDGRYRVHSLLGQGGMGNVYEAEHLRIGRRVAIKTLLPQLVHDRLVLERFHNEARAASTIGHDNIVDVLDMGQLENGSPYIVMEKLVGMDLHDLLYESGPMTVGRIVRIVRPVCAALAAAHEVGIVHRDLKPANIFLVERASGEPVPKILDFGISKFRTTPDDQGLTATGVAIGTPAYMSPEQAEGRPTVDHRTDVYAVGVILYEALTGKKPFEAESYAGLIIKVLMVVPAPPTMLRNDLPEELSRVVMRAFAKKPEDRFASALELAEALEPFATIDTAPALVGHRSSDPRPSATQALPGQSSPDEHVPEASAEAPVPEHDLPAAPGRSRAPLFAAFGAMVVIGLVALSVSVWALAGGRGDDVATASPAAISESPPEVAPQAEPPQAEPPQAEPPQAEAPAPVAEVRIRIQVVPSEARVFIGDVAYPNPMNALQPRSLTPTPIRIEADGYRSIERLVVFDSDHTLDLEMAREATPTTRRRRRGGGGASSSQAEAAPSGESEGMHREF